MNLFLLIGIAVIVVLAGIFLFTGYLKAPPDQAYVISGVRKKPRILVGQAGFKIPFFERVDKLALGAVQIDVKTGSAVPTAEFINIRVDSNVNVRVGQSPEMIELACQNFLNVPREEINRKVRDLLEGNVREIVGQMRLTDMVSDRKKFSQQVQENAVPDLANFGLELISFNVQNFVDDNQVIENLGVDNIAQISKKAAIAKSDAQREVSIAEAQNAKEANDAKVKAAEEIAVQNNALAVRKAELQMESDTEQAKANAAMAIEAERQRKTEEIERANANIAKAEREKELKKEQIKLKEYELDALVRKQADADKYAAEQEAEADKIRRQKDAEARAYEIQQEAMAMKQKADAEMYAAEQRAKGIAAVGLAEAEAIEKKAEAQKKMGEASVIEMYLNALPQIVANAAAPLSKVDKIIQYGDGNSAKMVQDIMCVGNQVMEGISESGVDLKSLLAGAIGGTMANN